MRRNNVIYFSQSLNKKLGFDDLAELLHPIVNEMCRFYSVVIQSDGNSNLTIRYAISENDEYNTITEKSVSRALLEALNAEDKPGVLSYVQPPLDLMIELYEPLIQKLAINQQRCWHNLEFHDLCQICRLTLITLYNKGYYIHKRLLEKSFNNAVLQEIRTRSQMIDTISFESSVEGEEDMEKITLKDTLCDVDEEYSKQDAEVKLANDLIFREVKDILIELIGERQFEQLFRDYANGHTTAWSRRKMQTIKTMFEMEGLTRQKFNNKYGR